MDFENTQEEILDRHRINITANAKCRTAAIGPASKAHKWRFQLFDFQHHDRLSLQSGQGPVQHYGRDEKCWCSIVSLKRVQNRMQCLSRSCYRKAKTRKDGPEVPDEVVYPLGLDGEGDKIHRTPPIFVDTIPRILRV